MATWGDLVLAGSLDREVKNLCFAKFPTTPGTLMLFEAFCPDGGVGEKGQFHQLMFASAGHVNSQAGCQNGHGQMSRAGLCPWVSGEPGQSPTESSAPDSHKPPRGAADPEGALV